MTGGLHEKSGKSVALLLDFCPSFQKIGGPANDFEFTLASGEMGQVTLKRAESTVNQIHVSKAFPVIVHVPKSKKSEECWYVLPVRWLLSYACQQNNPTQHAEHALSCCSMSIKEIPGDFLVQGSEISDVASREYTAARDDSKLVLMINIARQSLQLAWQQHSLSAANIKAHMENDS